MTDAREALVQIIAGSEWDWRNITPERIADAILAAGWTPHGERVKPTLEQVVDALAAQPPGSAEWTSSRLMQTARAVLALLPGRSEAEVKAETWDEVADYHDRTNAPDIAESTRRDNPYRKGQS